MQLPNAITLARVVVGVVSFVFLQLAVGAVPDRVWTWCAFWTFMVAACTDFLDGWLARRWKQVTPLGRVLDPFADKVLTCGAMIFLLEFEAARAIMPHWLVVVTIAREFLVTAVRGAMEAQGHAFPADKLGKWKMVMQSASCAGLMTVVAGARIWYEVSIAATWLGLGLGVVSGVQYCWRARVLLR